MRNPSLSGRPVFFFIALGLITWATPVSGQSERKVTRLAEGVYEIEHRDAQDGFTGGNTTVIIGERQVFVVDASFLPADAREDIAQIRQWTSKPVAIVLNTHFHNDHNLGNRAYMEAFPAVTIIAQEETRKDMDRFGPGSRSRLERGAAAYRAMLERGTTSDGSALTAADKSQVQEILDRHTRLIEELKTFPFQSATMSFTDGLTVDLGNQEVQVRFQGRGNTAGDAVAWLPREKILVAGDLVVHPIPFFYDGYPSEWIGTMENLARLEATTIVPGHGPVLHDNTYLFLVRDLLKAAVDQMNMALSQTGPAMFRTVDQVRERVDLTPFRQRFAGNDASLGTAFDEAATSLVNVVFREASLR